MADATPTPTPNPRRDPDNLDARPGRRVTPKGDPIDWTREQVADLAHVTDADKVDARAYWRRNAPRVVQQRDGSTVDARELIDARAKKGGPGGKGQ